MRRGRREKGKARKKRRNGDALGHRDSFFFFQSIAAGKKKKRKKKRKRVVRGISSNYIFELKDSDRRLSNVTAVYL